MQSKIIFIIGIFTLIIISGCISRTNNDSYAKSSVEAVQPKNQVFALINIDYPENQTLICRDEFWNKQTISLDMIDTHDNFTDHYETDIFQYRIRVPEIEIKYRFERTLEKNLNWSVFNDFEVTCKTRFADEINVTAEIYDEGFKEEREIKIWDDIEVVCRYRYEYNEWSCYLDESNYQYVDLILNEIYRGID